VVEHLKNYQWLHFIALSKYLTKQKIFKFPTVSNSRAFVNCLGNSGDKKWLNN